MTSLPEFNLNDTVAVLTRTPATLDAPLRGMPDVWVRSDEAEDTWSAFDIVGHLIFGERTDWMCAVKNHLSYNRAADAAALRFSEANRPLAYLTASNIVFTFLAKVVHGCFDSQSFAVGCA
jgi:hypothetical protein